MSLTQQLNCGPISTQLKIALDVQGKPVKFRRCPATVGLQRRAGAPGGREIVTHPSWRTDVTPGHQTRISRPHH
jgi:hypothetical protein